MPLTFVTGALAPAVFALSFWWSLVAIVLGNVVGALFMALHSAQGPRLGVPQMIQSRAQFGQPGDHHIRLRHDSRREPMGHHPVRWRQPSVQPERVSL